MNSFLFVSVSKERGRESDKGKKSVQLKKQQAQSCVLTNWNETNNSYKI